MYFDELLDYCNGVMLFEGMENSRGYVPMTDQSGINQFQAGQEKQMDKIWDMMFPHSIKFMIEKENKIAAFKSRVPTYKALAKKFQQERGGK